MTATSKVGTIKLLFKIIVEPFAKSGPAPKSVDRGGGNVRCEQGPEEAHPGAHGHFLCFGPYAANAGSQHSALTGCAAEEKATLKPLRPADRAVQ